MKSPSSRRAWIEMAASLRSSRVEQSRPPHGGRGLKSAVRCGQACRSKSPSSRRAWIEIADRRHRLLPYGVALLTEGVD